MCVLVDHQRYTGGGQTGYRYCVLPKWTQGVPEMTNDKVEISFSTVVSVLRCLNELCEVGLLASVGEETSEDISLLALATSELLFDKIRPALRVGDLVDDLQDPPDRGRVIDMQLFADGWQIYVEWIRQGTQGRYLHEVRLIGG